MVRIEGVEPSRFFNLRILSPVCLPIPPYPHIPTTAIAQERLLYTARKEPSPFITVRKELPNIYNPLLIVSDKLCCWLYVIIISHFLSFVNRILKKL